MLHKSKHSLSICCVPAGSYCGLCMCVLSHSVVSDLFFTLWTLACQVPLSMGFSRQEYLSELLFSLNHSQSTSSLPFFSIKVGKILLFGFLSS